MERHRVYPEDQHSLVEPCENKHGPLDPLTCWHACTLEGKSTSGKMGVAALFQ